MIVHAVASAISITMPMEMMILVLMLLVLIANRLPAFFFSDGAAALSDALTVLIVSPQFLPVFFP
jgi:putative effector of murein hydrolase LrgA (UPF0299 family)